MRARIPVDFALEVASTLRVGLHANPFLPPAFFDPRVRWSSTGGGPFLADAAGPSVNLLTADYLSDGELVSPLALPIDRAQPYFEALLDAYFELEVAAASDYAEVIRRRAPVAFPSVPEGEQEVAYRQALSSFGSDILTVALQIHAAIERHAARGSDLCRWAGSSRPSLFTLWRRDLDDGHYPGQFRDASGRWRMTAEFLPSEDKRIFIDGVLEGRWSGDPDRDFCRGP